CLTADSWIPGESPGACGTWSPPSSTAASACGASGWPGSSTRTGGCSPRGARTSCAAASTSRPRKRGGCASNRTRRGFASTPFPRGGRTTATRSWSISAGRLIRTRA
ncbi:MAG: hypothetical protein AVDCRST_MAG68-1780, partial [uncultured Gemmatimonadetes bacterium]